MPKTLLYIKLRQLFTIQKGYFPPYYYEGDYMWSEYIIQIANWRPTHSLCLHQLVQAIGNNPWASLENAISWTF